MTAYNFRGEWGFPISTPFALGDVVTMGGLFWRCNLAGTKAQPGTNTDWILLGDSQEFFLRPVPLKRETFPRLGNPIADVAPPFLSGQMYGQAIVLMAGDLVTNIELYGGLTASATVTNMWVALYNSTPSLLRQSTAAAAVISAAPARTTKALSSPVQISVSGLYYIVFMSQSTTMPSMQGMAQPANFAATTAPILGVTDTTHVGLTTTAPSPASFVAGPSQLYMGVS